MAQDTAAGGPGGDAVESRVERLVELMNTNDLVELELEEEDCRIRLRKREETPGTGVVHVNAPQAGHSGPAPAAAPAADAGEAAPDTSGLHEIVSPMVGTFYRSPNPTADAFVDTGSDVDDETVVCIVEAMKVMNEIKAEVTGEIVEICVDNGEPVEFGQVLFRVRPA